MGPLQDLCYFQIAYVVGQIIDNGEAIVNRAGRIDPQFERMGLVTYTNQYLYDWGLSKGVKSMVFTTSDSNPSLNKPAFRELTRHILTMVRTLANSTELSRY